MFLLECYNTGLSGGCFRRPEPAAFFPVILTGPRAERRGSAFILMHSAVPTAAVRTRAKRIFSESHHVRHSRHAQHCDF